MGCCKDGLVFAIGLPLPSLHLSDLDEICYHLFVSFDMNLMYICSMSSKLLDYGSYYVFIQNIGRCNPSSLLCVLGVS